MADIDSLSIRISADAGGAITSLNRLATTLQRINSISVRAGGAVGGSTTAMNRVGSAASKLNGILGKTGKAFSSAFDALTYIPRKVAVPFIKAVGKMGSAVIGLGRQLARVAMYRALRTAIKLVTKAFSEGIENLYKWSSVFDKTFYKAMNTIATAKTYFANSVAAMASPLIEAFAPAIDTIIDKFVEMFNIANQFFARLAGNDTYTAARKVQTAWDDVDESVDNTNTHVKELRKTLLGFDEINRLDKAVSETSSGGSNRKPPDTTYMYMFEQRPIDGAVANFADMLRQAFENSDWAGLGKLLGDKLNGLIDLIDFAGLGRKLGKGIDAMFTALYWFLVTFDASRVGEGIAEFLNEAINSIDFEMVGRALVRWFTNGVDALIAFLIEFDMGQLATKLSDFCVGVFTEIYDWFASYDNWSEIGRKIGDNIAAAILNIRYGEIWETLSMAVDKAVESIIELVTGAVSGLTDKFKEAMNWEELPESIQNTVVAITAIGAILTFAAGAAFAFSGYNIPLGLALMATSGILGMVSISLKWDLVDMVKEHMGAIKFVISAMGFAVGAALAFSGMNIPLGISLMIMSGALGSTNAKEAWDSIEDAVGRAMFGANALAGTFQLTIGILALISKNYGVGFALVAAGAVELVTGATGAFDFGSVGNILRQILPAVEALIGGFELTLGILAFIARKYALGFALIIGGIVSMGVGAYSGYNFDAPKNSLTNSLAMCEMGLGGFLLSLGLIAIIAQKWAIGIGLVLAGVEELSIGAAQYDWDSLKNKFDEVLGDAKVTLLRGVGMTVIGAMLCLTHFWGMGIPMLIWGLAQIGYGAVRIDWGALDAQMGGKLSAMVDAMFSPTNVAVMGTVGTLLCMIGLWKVGLPLLAYALIGLGYHASRVDWDQLGKQIKETAGNIKDWLADKGKLVLGILAMVGNGISTGLKPVVDGVKELWQAGTENWNGLVNLGKTAIDKVKEGWDKANEFTVSIKSKVDEELRKILAWLGVDISNSIQNTPTEPYSPEHYGESFPGTGRDHNVIMKLSATAGPGFTYSGGMLYPNIPNNTSVGVTIGPMYNDAGERVYTNDTLGGIGLSNLKTNVGIGVNTVWSLFFGGILAFLKLTKLKTSIGVDTSNAWTNAHKTFLQYIDVVGKTTTVTVNAKRGNFANGLGAWIGYNTHTVTVNLVRGNWYWGLSEWIGQEVWVRVNLWAGGGVVYGNGYSVGFANGGIITRSGWSHLDKAANGGTKPHGTMFVAGEAGPEIVGNIGGRTEILNKSQLASTMFASVSAAIAPAVKAFTSMGTMFAQAANEAMNASIYTIDRAYARVDAFAGNASMMDSTTAENMTEMLELMRANAEATMEQNRLLQQQNEYLRQINEKEFSADISTAAINKAQQRTNRRAGVTVVALGT